MNRIMELVMKDFGKMIINMGREGIFVKNINIFV